MRRHSRYGHHPVRRRERRRRVHSAQSTRPRGPRRAGDAARRARRGRSLADALWGDTPPASWVKNLQGCVMRLRKALGSAAIQTSSQGYRLRVPADEIDAQRFERLVTRGREMLALEQPERAAYLLGEALALWQGRPFLELEEWDPGRIEAGRLDKLRLEAEEAQIDATLQAGHHRDVLARAQSLADEAPLRERRWELLARAQYRAGHRPTRYGPSTVSVACSWRSWDSIRARASRNWSRRSCGRTRPSPSRSRLSASTPPVLTRA